VTFRRMTAAYLQGWTVLKNGTDRIFYIIKLLFSSVLYLSATNVVPKYLAPKINGTEWVLRLLLWVSWRVKSSGMWRHAIWHVGNTVAEDSYTCIIRIRLVRGDHLVRLYRGIRLSETAVFTHLYGVIAQNIWIF